MKIKWKRKWSWLLEEDLRLKMTQSLFPNWLFPPCWSPPAARWWPRACALPRAKVLKFPDWCLALGTSWRLVKGWWREIWWAQKLELSLLKSWQNAYWNLATLLQQINRNQQFINDLSHARLRGASSSTSIKLNFCKVKTAQRYLGVFRGAPNLQAFHIASPSGTGDAPTPKRPVPNRQQDNQIFKASAFRELQSLPNHPTPHNPRPKKKTPLPLPAMPSWWSQITSAKDVFVPKNCLVETHWETFNNRTWVPYKSFFRRQRFSSFPTNLTNLL